MGIQNYVLVTIAIKTINFSNLSVETFVRESPR